MPHEMLLTPNSKPMVPLLGVGIMVEKANSCQRELWEGLRSDTSQGCPSLVLCRVCYLQPPPPL